MEPSIIVLRERIVKNEVINIPHSRWQWCHFVQCVIYEVPGQEFRDCTFESCEYEKPNQR